MFWATMETAIGCPSLAFFKHSIHSPGLRGATKLMMNLGMMPCPTYKVVLPNGIATRVVTFRLVGMRVSFNVSSVSVQKCTCNER